MTTLSNILRWFTVSFYKGEVESDIADAYKAILLGLETVAVPPKAWIRLEGRRASARFRCEDEAGAIEATKAFVMDRKCWYKPALRGAIRDLYGRTVNGSDTEVLPALTLLKIYTEELERRGG